MFVTGEFRRVNVEKIKETNMLENYNYFYMQNLLNTLELEAIRKKNVKVVIGRCDNFVYEMMEKVLRDLNCTIINERRVGGEDNLSVLAQKVVNNEADFGIQLSNDAESMIVIDDKGNIIKDDLYTALLSIISVSLKETNQIVVPFTTTEVMEQIATKYNAGIVRIEMSPHKQNISKKTPTPAPKRQHFQKLPLSSCCELGKNNVFSPNNKKANPTMPNIAQTREIIILRTLPNKTLSGIMFVILSLISFINFFIRTPPQIIKLSARGLQAPSRARRLCNRFQMRA
jgi:hypothetical protein